MQTGTPSLGVQMIALDDEKYIERALNSLTRLRPDYVAIVDGGSTDATMYIIEKFEDTLNILCETVPWQDNFSDQRNNVLALGRPTDWFIRLDTDEAIPDNMIDALYPALSVLPPECLAVRIKQVNLWPDEDHYAANLGGWETHPRIFRGNLNAPHRYRWVGQVHESLHSMTQDGLKPIPSQIIWNWNVSVVHYGWLDAARRQEREVLYSRMPGSGIGLGDLTGRNYVVRQVPPQIGVSE